MESLGSSESLPQEIERKFVVEQLPQGLDLANYPSKVIAQGYMAVDDRGAVRVRRKGDKCFITYKSHPAEHTAQHTELEAPLTAEQFAVLWSATSGRQVNKVRYEIPFHGHTIELDVFTDELEGHMLAEIEFDSTDEADACEVPDWFGPEVTGIKAYGNASIADNGWPA